MTLTIAFVYPSSPNIVSTNDKLLISGLFISSCIFGISLAIHPGWFRRLIKHGNQDSNKEKSKKTKLTFKGHHPDCDQFKHHILTVNDKIHCAGCLGLALGSLLSIFLGVIYVIFINKFSFIFYFLI